MDCLACWVIIINKVPARVFPVRKGAVMDAKTALCLHLGTPLAFQCALARSKASQGAIALQPLCHFCSGLLKGKA